MPTYEERKQRKQVLAQRFRDEILKARADLDRAESDDQGEGTLSQTWWYAVKLADALYRARQYRDALEAYDRAIAINPEEAGTASILEDCRRQRQECLRQLQRGKA